jgi:hypothetical protein
MDSGVAQFKKFAAEVRELCTHVSVRADENGPYVFALGLKETHTLQMRKIGNAYALELWYGENSAVERIVEEPVFKDVAAAFARAKEWLQRDAI